MVIENVFFICTASSRTTELPVGFVNEGQYRYLPI